MIESTEELKLVLDLAASNGKKEAQNEMLEARNKQYEETIAMLKGMLEQKDEQLAEKDRQLAEKDEIIENQNQRISEMEAIVANSTCAADSQKKVVLVKYIVLDGSKTVSYVRDLDNNQRMFAGHMLLHTMASITSKQIYDQVNEITQLASDTTERLTDALEKVAERPTYNYESGATHDDKRSQLFLGEEKEDMVQLKKLSNE